MKKALIIDDTKNIRNLLVKCLELEGYETETAANGKEGLELLQGGSYDLIMLDIKLPEISGTEVLRKIRTAGVRTPVIVITAYPTIRNAVECTRLGGVLYLQKPFTAERLKNVLGELGRNIAGGEDNMLKAAEDALQAGDINKAFSCIGSALAANPQNTQAYLMFAEAYERAGDPDSADKFRRASQLFGE